MSTHKTIDGLPVLVTGKDTLGAQRVRLTGGTMPVLGTVERCNLSTFSRPRMGWRWTPHPTALAAPGQRAADVPAELLAGGGEPTQDAALTALMAWLREHEAPVLEHGPGAVAREAM